MLCQNRSAIADADCPRLSPIVLRLQRRPLAPRRPLSACRARCLPCVAPAAREAPRRPRVVALSPRGEPPSAGLPAARVSRSPDLVRQAVKTRSPQRLLAAYKYPVCLAACICRRCGVRFVINARPKGRAAGNTANNITTQATHHNTTTQQQLHNHPPGLPAALATLPRGCNDEVQHSAGPRTAGER